MSDITVEVVESGRITVSAESQSLITTTAMNGDVIRVSVGEETITVNATEQNVSATVTNGAIVSVSVPNQPISATVSASLYSGLSDAPSDGSTYARKDGAWDVVGGAGAETDPVFSASPAASIENEDIASWDAKQNALGFTPVNKTGDTMTGDLIGTDFVKTRSGTVVRNPSGQITSVVKTGGRTVTFIRTGGLISSVSDGTRTWTFSRDGNDRITGWEVA
jgi:YD repeat-containing protein